MTAYGNAWMLLCLTACSLGAKLGLDQGAVNGVAAKPASADGGFDFDHCLDAGVSYYCPEMGEELCRLEVIRQAHAVGCTSDADCVKADYVANCLSYGLCEPRPSVLGARKSAFEAALNAELSAFCSRTNCGGGSCVELRVQAICEQGTCQSR